MKVILSRKGCDSAFGGIPSVILPDGKIINVPIPGEDSELITYGDINYGNNIGRLSDLISELSSYIRLNGEKYLVTEKTKCHMDPDINGDVYPRDVMWKGCFGQIGAAQTVLSKSKVEKGDLFLFFGWFNRTYYKNNSLHYCKGEGFHMIYGWLQIEEIIYTHQMQIPYWLKYHPHANKEKIQNKSNCIYVGKTNLTWNEEIRGYGVFNNYDESLVLTKEGMSRSRWRLPDSFKGIPITYHSEKSWKDDYFQSACRGQEFVFQDNPFVEDWARDIIGKNVSW